MRKRKGRSETSETLGSKQRGGGGGGGIGLGRKGFFACYLLSSLNPRHKGHTYIGFTVNPSRRIRQHNGEIGSGAFRTKSRRPWEMVLCIYGFPTNISALQFEWAWQHPKESLVVRKAAASFKSLSGIANKIKLAYTMLTLPTWQSLDLTVNFFSTKYTVHSAGCPNLPDQMKVQVLAMDELPCYSESFESLYCKEDEDDSEDFSAEGLGDEITVNKSAESCNCIDENIIKLTDSASLREERRQSFYSMISSLGIPSPLPVTSPCYTDVDMFEEVKTSGKLILDGDKDQSRINVRGEVEIIDVFTPSPEWMMDSCSKKKRRFNPSQIIDLTKSPIFVQL